MRSDGGNLFRAQAALSFLRHITTYYNDQDTGCPPETFGFGLSTILGYIEDEIIAASNELTEKEKPT
jgi:hypothetical protein